MFTPSNRLLPRGLPLWEGPADVRAEAKTDVTREYYNLSPTICRPHFKSNKVRIEIDSETIVT